MDLKDLDKRNGLIISAHGRRVYVGINPSILYTCFYPLGLLAAIGDITTPTLNMAVSQIDAFALTLTCCVICCRAALISPVTSVT